MFLNLPFLFDSPGLAVVPVFVNAGAALLPALFAGLASALALLFKPKELFRVCREKPQIPLIVVVVGVLLYFLIQWMATPEAIAETPKRRTGSELGHASTDWSQVALEVLRQEARGRHAVSVPTPVELPSSDNAGMSADSPPSEGVENPADRPLVYRGGYERSGHQGGPSPTELSLLWEFRQDDTMVLSSPLVFGKHVYCATAYLDPPGTYGSVFCLDAITGELLWETFLKSPSPEVDFKGFFSSPALTTDGKYLIIGQGLHTDAEAELVCLDAATGDVKWLLPTPLHIESSP
ncbi:MAG: PQQ-binding-like beta-propeller repeat protein, partial [Candidatus Nealsonbacteria bacterium]|nr:PQQ-binding-like beta-propeller repeat protein [Candidatus Nealsonbacteria bacterium]